jgi:hypothetical protein
MGSYNSKLLSLFAVTTVLLLLSAAAQQPCIPVVAVPKSTKCLSVSCCAGAFLHRLHVWVQLQQCSSALLFRTVLCLLGAQGITSWRHSIMILCLGHSTLLLVLVGGDRAHYRGDWSATHAYAHPP